MFSTPYAGRALVLALEGWSVVTNVRVKMAAGTC